VEREWLLAVAVEYGTGSETGVRGGGDEGRRERQLGSRSRPRPHGSKIAFKPVLFCVCARASRANLSCCCPSLATLPPA
jgi:hypothetical protein